MSGIQTQSEKRPRRQGRLKKIQDEMEFPGKQGSEKWVAYRKHLLTASEVASAIGISPFATPYQLLRKKIRALKGKKPDDEEEKPDDESQKRFDWGHLHEPKAIAMYEKKHNCINYNFDLLGIKQTRDQIVEIINNNPKSRIKIPPVGLNYLGGSPDGITSDNILLEVKCPYNRKIIPGHIPIHYYPQIQVQLQLLKKYEINKAHFVQYDPRKDFLDVIEISRDEKWWKKHQGKMEAFWSDVNKYKFSDVKNNESVSIKRYSALNPDGFIEISNALDENFPYSKPPKDNKSIDKSNKFLSRIRNNTEMVSWFLAILGLVILGIYANLIEPDRISLSEIPNYENQVVIVEGTIISSYQTSGGSWIIYIDDNTTENPIPVFASSINFVPHSGAIIEVKGECQRYKGDWEIVAQSSKGVREIESWVGNQPTIEDLARFPNDYVDWTVRINATVTDSPYTYGNYTYLYIGSESHSLRVKVYVSSGFEVPTLVEGEIVVVQGIFEYDDYGARYQFVITEEEHGIWPLS